MPRSRRRHHSRSRSRSRSHSHDRDREPKRRKIESFDSPQHRRSVSSEPEANENSKNENINQETIIQTDVNMLENKTCEENTSKKSEIEVDKVESKIEIYSIRDSPKAEEHNISEDCNARQQTGPNYVDNPDLDKNNDEIQNNIPTDSKNENNKVDNKIGEQDDNQVKDSKAHRKVTSDLQQEEKCIDDRNQIIKKSEVSEMQNPKECDNYNEENSQKSKEEKNLTKELQNSSESLNKNKDEEKNNKTEDKTTVSKDSQKANETDKEKCSSTESQNPPELLKETEEEKIESEAEDIQDITMESVDLDCSEISKSENMETKPLAKISDIKTPIKPLTPKQIQKKLESEKKRLEKIKEKEEREKKRQEERDEKKRVRDKLKQEKEDLKSKEKELKLKEKEHKDKEKELRRKEKEDKELKRKEKEQERIKKQQEIDEENRKKQKIAEQKQKAAAAFANFFVPKSTEEKKKEEPPSTCCNFVPFEVKSNMRLAPLIRNSLTESQKIAMEDIIETQKESELYLKEITIGKQIGKSGKTWPYEDSADDVIILEDLGESIIEEKAKSEKMKAKFLKFHENQRPPYFGTWRKKSKIVTAKTPLKMDKDVFNYEIDSDEEWEDEVDGESITGSDAEDKETETENDNEYEVDNDVFVPHGHLSDDEGVDDEEERMCPEAHKAKLKLLKNQFEEERKSKTQKIKPRFIGCIWYDEDKKVDEAIHRYLQPFSYITNGIISIKKRSDPVFHIKKREKWNMDKELIPDFLKLVHGNTNKKALIVNEFVEYLTRNNINAVVTKIGMIKQLKLLAQYVKCPEEGAMHNKMCWFVNEDIRRKYNVELQLPNKWKYLTKDV